MIIPCIDLMDGKVVQLVQGREKVLEASSPDEMLKSFAGFPTIQVIDLNAALGNGSNDAVVDHLAHSAAIRAGGGVRTVERAEHLVRQGVYRVIIGTSAFSDEGPNFAFLNALRTAIGHSRVTVALDSRNGHIVVKGWKESTNLAALDVVSQLEPYCSGFLCTYVDKEGMMQGTDLVWFESLRRATRNELIAAGGITSMEDVRVLTSMGIHCAIGMALYTGRLSLDELRMLNQP